MGETKIEWTATRLPDGTVIPGYTFNGWIGCTKVSPGCEHCYAETLMAERYQRVKWGPQGTRQRTNASNWRKPLAWNRKAEAEGRRARVFCKSLADVAEDRPELVEMQRDLTVLIDQTPNLDWLLLTKRPQNFNGMIERSTGQQAQAWLSSHRNVWVGTSVESQEWAEKRLPELMKIHAAVRFISAEPLLGPLDLSEWLSPDISHPSHGVLTGDSKIDWVIVGGESGAHARPLDPAWVLSLRDQCQAAGVPFFFKQWGEWIPTRRNMWPSEFAHRGIGSVTPISGIDRIEKATKIEIGEYVMAKVGKKFAGRTLEWQTWNESPSSAT